MTDEPKPTKRVRDLNAATIDRGRVEASRYEFPDSLAIGATSAEFKRIETAWRAGLAVGWAVRDSRDDEPPVGAWVWVIDSDGDHFVGVRIGETNAVDAFPEQAVWEISGRPQRLTWREVIEDAREWGRLDKVD